MAKPVMVIGIALASMVTVSTVLAEPSGEMLSQTCAGCHGTEGKLNGASAFVPLSGMSATSFEKAMKDFATGSRPNTLMGPIAKGFTEGEIKAMAAYFAKQPK